MANSQFHRGHGGSGFRADLAGALQHAQHAQVGTWLSADWVPKGGFRVHCLGPFSGTVFTYPYCSRPYFGAFFRSQNRARQSSQNAGFFHFLCAKKRACDQILARSHRLGRCKTASAASPKGRLGMELRFLFLILTSVIHNRTCISVSKCKHNLDGHCDETVEPQQTQCKSHIILYAQVCAWQTHSPSSSTL